MEYFFFSDKERKKYELFKLVQTNQGINISQIIEQKQMSSTNIRRCFQELNEELALIFPEDNTAITYSASDGYQVIFPHYSTSYALNALKLFYIKRSNEFLIFNRLINKHYVSINQLALDISISTSHLYKYIKDIKAFLKKFNLFLNFSFKQSGNTSIVGSEIDKLYFLNIYYWYIYQAIEEPEIVEDYPVAKMATLSPFQQKRLQYLFSISKHGAFKATDVVLNPDSLAIATILQETHSDTLASMAYQGNDHVALLESLFMRIFIPEFDCDQEKQTIAKNALKLKNNKIVNNSKLYLKQLFDTYQIVPSDEHYHTCLYYTLMVHSFLGTTTCDFFTNFEALSTLSDLTTEELNFEKLERELAEFYKDLLTADNGYDFVVTPHNMMSMIKFSSLLLDLSSTPQVLNIHISFSKNNFATQMLKKNLIDIFGSSNISLIDTPQEADVILSDFYQLGMAQDKFYYFDDPYNHTSWDEAIAFIVAKAYKKKALLDHRRSKT